MNYYAKRRRTLVSLEAQLMRILNSKAVTDYTCLFPQHPRLIAGLEDLIVQVKAIQAVDLE